MNSQGREREHERVCVCERERVGVCECVGVGVCARVHVHVRDRVEGDFLFGGLGSRFGCRVYDSGLDVD